MSRWCCPPHSGRTCDTCHCGTGAHWGRSPGCNTACSLHSQLLHHQAECCNMMHLSRWLSVDTGANAAYDLETVPRLLSRRRSCGSDCWLLLMATHGNSESRHGAGTFCRPQLSIQQAHKQTIYHICVPNHPIERLAWPSQVLHSHPLSTYPATVVKQMEGGLILVRLHCFIAYFADVPTATSLSLAMNRAGDQVSESDFRHP